MVDYRDVLEDEQNLEAMLDYSEGRRKVPIIVETDGNVSIGFNGRA